MVEDCSHGQSAIPHPGVQGRTIDNPSLAMVETVSIAWFPLEYFIRSSTHAFLKLRQNLVL